MRSNRRVKSKLKPLFSFSKAQGPRKSEGTSTKYCEFSRKYWEFSTLERFKGFGHEALAKMVMLFLSTIGIR